jgi:cytochrome P450
LIRFGYSSIILCLFLALSITLTYALYLLAKHPDIEATCLEEIDAVIGKGTNGRATSSEITTSFDGPEQLPYTKAVILETLRLYPPAPVTSRTMEKEAVLQNPTATVQKGQNVMVPIWCIQRNEKNFPKPTEMHPERWVRRIKNAVHNNKGSVWEERPVDDFESNLIVPPANRDAFCVFAAGARNCVGRILAMQESVTLLALLVRRLKFKLVNDDYEVRPTICAVVQQPNDNLPMIITAR